MKKCKMKLVLVNIIQPGLFCIGPITVVTKLPFRLSNFVS